jgi:hypothetical protein
MKDVQNVPTLADAIQIAMLDKRRWGGASDGCYQTRVIGEKVLTAHKFILDKTMSEYLTDLSQSGTGSLRARLRTAEAARRLARLPHEKTWIEFDYHVVLDRLISKFNKEIVHPHSESPKRVGWLLRQHEHKETAFILTEVTEQVIIRGLADVPHPYSIAWSSDDSTLPWPIWGKEMDGYSNVGFTFTYSEAMSKGILDRLMASKIERNDPLCFRLSVVWKFLATLNDLPTDISRVPPSRGYFARGSYRKFFEHKIIHLTVPQARWQSLTRKLIKGLKRRAHQVRGHWRNDWHRPINKDCKHDWSELMVCRSCGGHYLWIAEHWRGDKTLGSITHDYTVSSAEKQQ